MFSQYILHFTHLENTLFCETKLSKTKSSKLHFNRKTYLFDMTHSNTDLFLLGSCMIFFYYTIYFIILYTYIRMMSKKLLH